VNKVILNGDILDIYSLSRWDKRPDRQLVREELEMGKKFMHQLRKMFPSEEIIFKVGNHEDRFAQYIMKKAPELFGLDCITLSELLDLKTLGIKYIGSSQLIQAGHLTILHGHEILNSGAVINVARTKRLKAQDNIMFGHHHRTQSDFATSIKGKLHGSYAVGCLCNLRPAYFTMAYQEWNHGFAIVDVKSDGMFKVSNRKIINGEVY
jgi:predicted phosphodiesterase